jgi:hypothetical protein
MEVGVSVADNAMVSVRVSTGEEFGLAIGVEGLATTDDIVMLREVGWFGFEATGVLAAGEQAVSIRIRVIAKPQKRREISLLSIR